MKDIRDDIFKTIADRAVQANITAVDGGMIAGTATAREAAQDLGLTILHWLADGASVTSGDTIAGFSGTPKQIAMAEDVIMGHMAKPSGIATAARRFVDTCGDRPKIVSGSWKKMPAGLKASIRAAVLTGGAAIRISDRPFIYMDKNYIKMLGGISASLKLTAKLGRRQRVVQIHGHFSDIAHEACEAAEKGADIVFIDTGQIQDARNVIDELAQRGLRQNVRLAFAGGIGIEDLDALIKLDLDILDIGRAIVDAPILDMRMDVRAYAH